MPAVRDVLKLAFVAGVVLLLAPPALALAGYPVVSYASSASMVPTIGVGDAFLINPFASDEVGVGDIVVFVSESRGGILAVHRIVGGDSRGWYTQGDANPTTDQSTGEPIVTPDRIRGRVVTDAEGNPYLVRHVGIPIQELKGQYRVAEHMAGGRDALLAVGFGLIAVLLAISSFASGDLPRPRRPGLGHNLRRRFFPRGILGRHLAIGLLLLLCASTAVAARVAHTDIHVHTIVMEGAPEGTDRAVRPGGSIERQMFAPSLGLLPTLVILEPATDGVRVPSPQRVPAWSSGEIPYQQVAVVSHGVQYDEVRVYRYPALLPESALIALHTSMPGSPFWAVAGLLALAGYAWYRTLGISRMPVERFFGIEEEWA